MQRIMIIGGPGSGKSTLARALADKLGLPVYHMDREVHWLPGWQERARADKMPLVEAIVARDEWVFEGGHSSSYDLRIGRADLLIWLDTPLWVRLVRVTRRTIRHRGQSRPDLQEGCEERLSMLPGFLWFILRIRPASRKRQAAAYATAPVPKHRFTNLSEVTAFVDSL